MFISKKIDKKSDVIQFILNKNNIENDVCKNHYSQLLLNKINNTETNEQYFKLLVTMLLDFSVMCFHQIQLIIQTDNGKECIYSWQHDELLPSKKNGFNLNYFINHFACDFAGYNIFLDKNKDDFNEYHILQIAEILNSFNLNENSIYIENHKAFKKFNNIFMEKPIKVELIDKNGYQSNRWFLNKAQMQSIIDLNEVFYKHNMPFLSIMMAVLGLIAENPCLNTRDFDMINKCQMTRSKIVQQRETLLNILKSQQDKYHTLNYKETVINSTILAIIYNRFKKDFQENQLKQAVLSLPSVILMFYIIQNIEFD